jgi:hypothetical protein
LNPETAEEAHQANGGGGSNGHHVHRDQDQLESADSLVSIHFEAKVLGLHQGTPLLRNGITLLHTHSNSSHSATDSEKSHFNIN